MTRRPRRVLRALAGFLLLGGMLLGGCAGPSATARSSSGTPTATPNLKGANATPEPTPQLPYTFPTVWHTPAGSPAGVEGFAFASSDPAIGYACVGTPSGSEATPTLAGGPSLEVTHDGGATWQALRSGPFAQGHACGKPFVDRADANDVFVAIDAPWPLQSSQYTFDLWRSRDGGATWVQRANPDANDPIALVNLLVIGGRIIVEVVREGAGTLPYYLLGSDDGGVTWTPLGQSLLSQRDAYEPVYALGGLVDAGASLYASLGVNCSGGCIEITPAPGQARPGVYRSTDRGTTWQPVSPLARVGTFTRSPSGAYYSVYVQAPTTADGPAVPYWSRDGGATWHALPTLAGVEGGYLDASALYGLIIAPDATVIATTVHRSASGLFPAGFFSLRATDATPAWRPLAPPGAGNLGLQAVSTATGARLWSIEDYAPLGQHLIYVDLP